MEAINSMRHVAIHNPAQYEKKRIALIGVGTIGSWLAHTLARMQVKMTMYDHDTIEEHNLATQTYGAKDVGKYKVDVVYEQLSDIAGHGHRIVRERFSVTKDKYDLIVSAVDSLEARKNIAKLLIEKKIETPIVDGRVGREQVEVYYFPNAQAWLEQLPDEGDTDPCGARFTAYSAIIAAGLMANTIKRVFMGQTLHAGRIIFDAASLTFIKE